MSRQVTVSLDKDLVAAVYKRDKYMCRSCRERRLHPHHVVFRSQGGPDIMSNLLSLCPQCHDAVHGGKLKIEVIAVLENDVLVRFVRMRGWRPR